MQDVIILWGNHIQTDRKQSDRCSDFLQLPALTQKEAEKLLMHMDLQIEIQRMLNLKNSPTYATGSQ